MSLEKFSSSEWQFRHHANKDHGFFSSQQKQDKGPVMKNRFQSKPTTGPIKKMKKGHKENIVLYSI